MYRLANQMFAFFCSAEKLFMEFCRICAQQFGFAKHGGGADVDNVRVQKKLEAAYVSMHCT